MKNLNVRLRRSRILLPAAVAIITIVACVAGMDFIGKHPSLTAILFLPFLLTVYFLIWRLCFPALWWATKLREAAEKVIVAEETASSLAWRRKWNRKFESYHDNLRNPVFSRSDVVNFFLEELSEESASRRSSALYVLRMLPEKRATPALLANLTDKKSDSFTEILKTLAEIGDRSAAPVLLELLETTSPRPNDLEAIVRALGRMGDRSAIPVLQKLVTDKAAIGKKNLLEALGTLGDRSAVPALLELLETSKDELGIAKALVGIGTKDALSAARCRIVSPRMASLRNTLDASLRALSTGGITCTYTELYHEDGNVSYSSNEPFVDELRRIAFALAKIGDIGIVPELRAMSRSCPINVTQKTPYSLLGGRGKSVKNPIYIVMSDLIEVLLSASKR